MEETLGVAKFNCSDSRLYYRPAALSKNIIGYGRKNILGFGETEINCCQLTCLKISRSERALVLG